MFFYAKSSPEATAFPSGEYNLRQANGTGLASKEKKIIFRTSPREIFTRPGKSATPAARSFEIVRSPNKTGHAQASRTRNCPNGSVFV